MRNEFEHDFQGSKRLGTPIDGNKGEESMFDFVPFAGRRRIMGHRDREVFLIGKLLQFLLPETISDPVGTAPIGGDEQFALAGVERFARLVPPSPDTLHRKFSRVMIDAHVDEPTVVDQIIDAIGDGLAGSQRKKVIHIHTGLLSFGLPLSSVVFKGAEQFLFLAVYRNDWVAFLLKLLTALFDMGKLGIAILVRFSFHGLLIRPQRVAK